MKKIKLIIRDNMFKSIKSIKDMFFENIIILILLFMLVFDMYVFFI